MEFRITSKSETQCRTEFQKLHWKIRCALRLVDNICQLIDNKDVVVTSMIRDPRPGHKSFHPLAQAADIDADREAMSKDCRRAVKAILEMIHNSDFRIQYVHEDEGTPNDHIHIEYDTKPKVMPI